MAKKDLQGAIKRGADLFFSANDQPQDAADAIKAKDAQEVLEAQEDGKAQQAQQPYRAQDVSAAALASTVEDMQDRIEAAEARKTQGRKGCKMPRLNISLTPSAYEYVKIMAGISGKSVTQFINDLVECDAAEHAERYLKAKEIMKDAR